MKLSRIMFIVFFMLICIVLVDYQRLKNENQLEKEEIDRINDFFQGSFEVYRIPAWMERAPVQDDISKLSYYVYLLQTESDKQKNILSGVPYWPFGSRKKALKVYNRLPEEEKIDYMVISQSIVYIAYMDEERVILLEEASKYFNNQYKD